MICTNIATTIVIFTLRPASPSRRLDCPELSPYEQYGVQSVPRRQIRKPCAEHGLESRSMADE